LKARFFERETWFSAELPEGDTWLATLRENGFNASPVERFGRPPGPFYELYAPLDDHSKWLFVFFFVDGSDVRHQSLLIAASLPEMLMLAERLRSYIIVSRSEARYQRDESGRREQFRDEGEERN